MLHLIISLRPNGANQRPFQELVIPFGTIPKCPWPKDDRPSTVNKSAGHSTGENIPASFNYIHPMLLCPSGPNAMETTRSLILSVSFAPSLHRPNALLSVFFPTKVCASFHSHQFSMVFSLKLMRGPAPAKRTANARLVCVPMNIDTGRADWWGRDPHLQTPIPHHACPRLCLVLVSRSLQKSNKQPSPPAGCTTKCGCSEISTASTLIWLDTRLWTPIRRQHAPILSLNQALLQIHHGALSTMFTI